jgi:hypothetical protein
VTHEQDDNVNGFSPYSPEERRALTEAAFVSVPGRRLQAHLLARAALNEVPDADQREIDRAVAESPDAGVAMADEYFAELPPQRQRTLRDGAWAMARDAIAQTIRQLEHGCNQLKIDPRAVIPPEAVALVAAAPVMLTGVLFELNGED